MLGGRVKTLHPKVHGGMWFIQDHTRVKLDMMMIFGSLVHLSLFMSTAWL